MVWMKLSRPCVRIKRPDSVPRPVPHALERRSVGQLDWGSNVGEQHSATMNSACPSLLSAQKSVTPTAAQPRVQSLQTGTYLLDGFPCFPGVRVPPGVFSLSPWDRPPCTCSIGCSVVHVGSASARLLDRPFRSTHGISLRTPPRQAASRVASPPAAPSSMWNRPGVSSSVSTASLLSDIYRRG